jgi:hypothetical protein
MVVDLVPGPHRFTSRKKMSVTMEFEVSKRHSSRPTLSTDMIQQGVQWEKQKWWFDRKRQGPMAEKYF